MKSPSLVFGHLVLESFQTFLPRDWSTGLVGKLGVLSRKLDLESCEELASSNLTVLEHIAHL